MSYKQEHCYTILFIALVRVYSSFIEIFGQKSVTHKPLKSINHN